MVASGGVSQSHSMVASDDDAWTSGALIRLVEIVSMATGACKTWDEDESEVVKDNLPSVREAWALILQGGSAAGRGQRAAVDQKLLTPEEKWKPIRELLGNPNFCLLYTSPSPRD